MSRLNKMILSAILVALVPTSLNAQSFFGGFGPRKPGVKYIGEPPVTQVQNQVPTPATEELPAPQADTGRPAEAAIPLNPPIVAPVQPAAPFRSAVPAAPQTVGTKPPASLGLVAEERSDRRGLTVVRVSAGSPAQRAGVKTGDVLMALGSRPTNSVDDVRSAMKTLGAGDAVTMEVARGNELYELRASLGDSPPPATGVPSPVGPTAPQGAATGTGHGLLGVTVEETPESPTGFQLQRGARVVSVAPGSPASVAGIVNGDAVVSVDAQVVHDSQDLIRFMLATRPGQSVEIGFNQNGVLKRRRITLAGDGDYPSGPLPTGARPGSTRVEIETPGLPDAGENAAPRRRIVIGGGNVGQILEGVGKTIDNILGGRRRTNEPMPQPVPSERLQPQPPSVLSQPAPVQVDRIPAPVNPAPREVQKSAPSSDAAEVEALRAQMKKLMERINTLENQLESKPAGTTPAPKKQPL